MFRTIALITAAGIAGAVLASTHSNAEPPTPHEQPAVATVNQTKIPGNPLVRKARALLVRAENRTGYDRDLFTHWTDADNDGCDTRREVIISEARTPVTVSGDCFITGGRWLSLYDQVTTTSYPANFDVDHLVPLAEAWDSGASTWTPERREAFANDLDNPASLILVTATSNRSKSDQDPAEWMPPNQAAWCGYLADWVTVKARWGLSVDRDERRFLTTNLRNCPRNATLTRTGR